ncbi:hypothetical protein LSAT2_015628, partial [Lamellibrachia satsuma]
MVPPKVSEANSLQQARVVQRNVRSALQMVESTPLENALPVMSKV